MAGTSIANLKAMLTLDTSKWMSGFSSAGKTATAFAGNVGSKFSGAMGSIGSRLGAAAAAAVSVGSAIHTMGVGMEQVDRQAKLADRLGITVTEVQKLALAADLAGTDIEVLARGMLKMGKNIGSGGMTLDKRLFSVADSLAKITDAGERAKQAEEIFGKGGLELINTLSQGSRGIRASADAIDRFGLGTSRIDAAKIEAANDAWTEMKTILGGMRNQVAVELAPTISGFIGDWVRGLGLVSDAIQNVNADMKATKAGIKDSADEYGRWYDNVLAVLGAGPGVGFGDIKAGLREQRRDADRNMMNAGRQSGAGLLGKAAANGGLAGKSVSFASGAAERGTVEAGRLIQGAINNPMTHAMKPVVDKLDAIKRNTDPRRAPAAPRMARARM